MREDIQKYRDTTAVSYSVLSALSGHPRSLTETDSEEKSHYTFGLLVDCLMFTPEDYNEMFYETSVTKPGDKMGDWLEAYLNLEIPADYQLHEAEELVLQARGISGYDKRLSDEVALKKFNETCLPYLDEVARSGGRLLITPEVLQEAIAMESKLLSNEFTARYFRSDDKDVEIKFQVPFYYVFEDLEFKSLADIVIYDHKNHTLEVADLKTTGKPLLYFEKDYTDYKYYIQASLYHLVAQLAHPEYTVMDYFDFIVANTTEEPMIWRANQEHLSLGLYGGVTRFGRKIRGVYQLIEDYKWHVSNQKFDYPASVYTNNGRKLIDVL